MTRARPVVWVTGPDRGGWPAWMFTAWAVRRAGGHPVRVRPSHPYHGDFHGLVLGGGADVDPARYGGGLSRGKSLDERAGSRWQRWVSYLTGVVVALLRRISSVGAAGLDFPRDALELELLRRAEAAARPVLGICRGAQLMSIHARGTLHQDLASFYGEASNLWTVLPRKAVSVQRGSHLYEAVGETVVMVNSLHRRAIAEPGDSLDVVARDDHGVTQAVEDTGRPFWIGVQWHPEFLPQRSEQLGLFRRLVEVARRDPAVRAPERPYPQPGAPS